MENKLKRYLRLKICKQRSLYREISSVLPDSRIDALNKELTVAYIIDKVTDTTDYQWRDVYKEMKARFITGRFNKVRVGNEVYYYNVIRPYRIWD